MNKIVGKPSKINGLKDIATKYNNFFFDLDGVVVLISANKIVVR
jgi:hypothetical protein